MDPRATDAVSNRRTETRTYGSWGDRLSRHLPAPRREDSWTAPQNRRERRLVADRCNHIMSSCRHHSGYLADDEAGHTTYLARVSVPSRA